MICHGFLYKVLPSSSRFNHLLQPAQRASSNFEEAKKDRLGDWGQGRQGEAKRVRGDKGAKGEGVGGATGVRRVEGSLRIKKDGGCKLFPHQIV